MKTRNGFVSNSSSSSFVIKNKTKKTLTMTDLVNETQHLFEEFLKEFDFYTEKHGFTLQNFLSSAKKRNEKWEPGASLDVSFGDEEGLTCSHVFDYMMRDGGETKSFSWRCVEIRGAEV